MDEIILEYLKTYVGMRIDYLDKWLVYDELDQFQVYQHPPYAKKTRILYTGNILKDALDILVGER